MSVYCCIGLVSSDLSVTGSLMDCDTVDSACDDGTLLDVAHAPLLVDALVAWVLAPDMWRLTR